MPFPPEYRAASDDLDRFLADVRDRAMLGSRNQAYAMTRAVLHIFRDRLPVQDVFDFADVAAILRAHADEAELKRLLRRLPAGAAEYWSA